MKIMVKKKIFYQKLTFQTASTAIRSPVLYDVSDLVKLRKSHFFMRKIIMPITSQPKRFLQKNQRYLYLKDLAKVKNACFFASERLLPRK